MEYSYGRFIWNTCRRLLCKTCIEDLCWIMEYYNGKPYAEYLWKIQMEDLLNTFIEESITWNIHIKDSCKAFQSIFSLTIWKLTWKSNTSKTFPFCNSQNVHQFELEVKDSYRSKRSFGHKEMNVNIYLIILLVHKFFGMNRKPICI